VEAASASTKWCASESDKTCTGVLPVDVMKAAVLVALLAPHDELQHSPVTESAD
jgi:hypothetical protein